MEEPRDLEKLKESLVGVTEFYTLLEYRSWGVQYRVFKTRIGAIQEGLNPGFISDDAICGYPVALADKAAVD